MLEIALEHEALVQGYSLEQLNSILNFQECLSDNFLASTYQTGSLEETKIYEDMYSDLWEETEGAVEWLCEK